MGVGPAVVVVTLPVKVKAIYDSKEYFVWFDSLHPSQQFFSHLRKGLPGITSVRQCTHYYNTATPPAVRLENSKNNKFC